MSEPTPPQDPQASNPPQERGAFGVPSGVGTPPPAGTPAPTQQPAPSAPTPAPGEQPPPGQPPAGGAAAAVQSAMQSAVGDSSGFFAALFDFSFTRFVTPMLVRFVYLLATVALGVSWLVVLISAFAQNVGYGLFVLVIGPVLLLIYLAVIRMTLEFYLSLVRMSEDIHRRLPQA